MKKLFKDGKHDNIIIAALASAALILGVVLLVSISRNVAAAREAKLAAEAPAPVAVPTAKPSPSPTPSPEPAEELIPLQLIASSTEADLFILVADKDIAPVIGCSFRISVTYPDGTVDVYLTNEDGTFYVADIPGGEYSISMEEYPGYAVPETVSCQVPPRLERVAVEVTEEVTTSSVAASETKTVTYEAPSSSSADAVEIISSAEVEAETQENSLVPVTDENGNQTYSYTYGTDENGYLYLRGTTEPSDVLLICEEVGGAVYGLRKVVVLNEETGETESEYYETVDLIYPDNSVNETYEIIAEPVMTENGALCAWQTIGGKTYYYNSDGTKMTGLKRIDGKLYFFDPNGVRARSLGIDVSFWNGSVNWSGVKADGIDFALIRVGGRGWASGGLYTDDCFYTNLYNAKSAGLNVGVYFYSTAINVEEAIQEASLVIEMLGGTYLDYPVFIDVEYSGDYPSGRADLISASARAEIVRAFCDTIQNSGYTAGVYSGQNFYGVSVDYGAISGYTIWLANYTRNFAFPPFAGRYDIWQFTDSGAVTGVNGTADLNVIF